MFVSQFLPPVLVVLSASWFGFTLAALYLPIIKLIRALSG
jgi:hypothetical protein